MNRWRGTPKGCAPATLLLIPRSGFNESYSPANQKNFREVAPVAADLAANRPRQHWKFFTGSRYVLETQCIAEVAATRLRSPPADWQRTVRWWVGKEAAHRVLLVLRRLATPNVDRADAGRGIDGADGELAPDVQAIGEPARVELVVKRAIPVDHQAHRWRPTMILHPLVFNDDA